MTTTNLAAGAGTTSASFTPTIGSLIVATWTGEANPPSVTVTDANIADSLGETTWTAVGTVSDPAFYSPFGFAMGKTWYGLATTHTARQLIVTGVGGTPGNNQLVVDQIDLTAVLHTAAKNTSFTTAPAATFTSTPATASYVYSVMFEFAVQAQTPPANETTHITTNYQGSGIATISSAANLVGSAPQSVAWTSVGGSYIGIRAIEVSAPPPPPPPTSFIVGHIPIT